MILTNNHKNVEYLNKKNMKNIKLLALTFITALSTSIWAQTGQYSTRTISTDGKTSTWAFNVVSGSAKTIPDGTDDNGVIYVNGGGSNKAQTSAYMSFNKSEVYLEVPSGSAGYVKGLILYLLSTYSIPA